MKKILVPVDFSDHTEITCTYALELAQKHGSEIVLFHTFFDQFLIAESSFPESIDLSTIYHEELLKETPGDAEAGLGLGLLEYRAGHKDEAVKRFNEALAADPKNAAALNNLGNVAFLDGNYAAAEKKYLSASEADAGDSDIWMNLVKTELHLNNKDKAGEYGKKAVALEASLAPSVETLLKAK